MGTPKGKVIAIYVCPDGIRICEGENRDGNPNITKYFSVAGVDSYFAPTGDGNYEVANMSGLVEAIVSAVKAKNILSRKVLIASSCFTLSTEVTVGDTGSSMKAILSGDVKDIIPNLTSKDDKVPPDKVMTRNAWGSLPIDGKIKFAESKTYADKYMIESLVKEFYSRGYSVLLLTGAMESVLNFKDTTPATFDSRGKIMFVIDTVMYVCLFLQDVLYSVEVYNIPMDRLPSRLATLVNQSIDTVGRSPKVYLAGSVFCDSNLYCECMDAIAQVDGAVYDLFGRPEVPADYQELVESGEMKPILSPDYAVNIALLMAMKSKNKIALSTKISFDDILKCNAEVGSMLMYGVAGVLGAITLVGGGITATNYFEMQSNPSTLDSLNSQMVNLSSRQNSYQISLDLLTKVDTTVLSLLGFVYANDSPEIKVVSIDTRDMLRGSVSVSSGNGSTYDFGTAGGTGTSGRESIVIRGYAKDGTYAVDYFDKLFRYGLTIDPVLNGVERYELPNGEEVYIFEIEVGGVSL